jgi:hypothetical protein
LPFQLAPVRFTLFSPQSPLFYVIFPLLLESSLFLSNRNNVEKDFWWLNNLKNQTDGRIAPRSGLAAKHSIQTGAGVIDADYRGQVKVLLFNHSDVDYAIAEGDRIAQLVIERIYTPEVLEVAELEASVRGAGGFGSTGVN